MKYKQLDIFPSNAAGLSLVELLVVMSLILIMTGVSLFSLRGHQKLYKPDEQALKIVDILQEARQRSLTQRRTMRVEIDSTARIVRLINENSATTAADDTELRRITLLPSSDARIDVAPTNVTLNTDTTNNPPETLLVPTATYKQSIYTGSVDNQICVLRFKSNGNISNGGTNSIGTGDVPTGVTLYVWAPKTAGSNQSSISRAITILGASGAIRMWEYDESLTGTNKWKDSRRSGAYAS